jgi:tRNA-dihydrouridine synthase B
VARIAEAAGVASIAVHGRTRACRFVGEVEYDTIASIKAAVSIPVFANGDIGDATQARRVLSYTNADGLLIGRAALGAPWLPGDIAEALASGRAQRVRQPFEVVPIVARHLAHMHAFYGDEQGVRIARKHVKAYLHRISLDPETISRFNAFERAEEQRRFVDDLAGRWTQTRAA